MREFFFAVPWWILALLAIVGLGLFVAGNGRQNTAVRSAGWGLILAALAWGVVSYLVDTPKEICEKQTRQFVQAVADRDWSRFDALTDPKIVLHAGPAWQIEGRLALEDAVKSDVEQIGLKSASVTGLQVSDNGPTILTHITVWSVQDYTMGRPLDSEWELDWHHADGRWLLGDVRTIRVSGVSLDQIRGALRKR